MSASSFHIYDASAGSGKTYTLVKEYLKVLLKSPYKDAYKNILAITFTNKAVGEMKSRIIDMLKAFSEEAIVQEPNSMFTDICIELSLRPEKVQQKAKQVLNSIVHNYAAFDISTIDKFTQKVIRTFAFDLHLPINFEVELDTETLLNKAVDNLIARAGTDKELTETLVDFAIEKTDDDKSWDVSYDFNQIAKLLVNENHFLFVDSLKNKSLSDFRSLKNHLKASLKSTQKTIVEEANTILTLINESGLESNDFNRGSLPKHFTHLANENFNVKFDTGWQNDLVEGHALYPKRVTDVIASTIDAIQPAIIEAFLKTKQQISYLRFLQGFNDNITPLSVLNEISKEVQKIKEEQNLLLISEFNSIISDHIKEQPAPFIYERIGEKFKHYFIDEFQDTSVMQWQNLVPLIGNALSGENASAMLVGDAKQAIYRWRGGKAEQFIALYNKDDDRPFHIKKNISNLPTNYRSFRQIVSFNNDFFRHLSTFAFSEPSYAQLFKNSSQNTFSDQEGYVNIAFLELDRDDDRHLSYPEKTLQTINQCLEKGYRLQDICILTRKRIEGFAVADYLTDNGIDIISSETLLVDNSNEVQFIISLLKYVLEPNNLTIKMEVLSYLATHKLGLELKHPFYKKLLAENIASFFRCLEEYHIHFNYRDVLHLPVYEAVEDIIYSFKLTSSSNAYLQFFLDFVLDFATNKNGSLLEFLDHYERKKEDLSIVSPEGKNAVQIMTIHKSKGLEFPIVIFPYADLDIYRERSPKAWIPVNKEEFHGFEYAYLNYNKDLETISDESAEIYTQHQSELELDNINLLYVALTRPIEQLYIITNKKLDRSGNESLRNFGGLFINYLKHENLWDASKNNYEFGIPEKTSLAVNEKPTAIEQQQYITTPKKNHNIKVVTNSGYLWDTTQQKAIEKGNLVHNILAHINTKSDIDISLNMLVTSGAVSDDQAEAIRPVLLQIVDHPKLSNYFSSAWTIYNERDIITKDGLILRPDRLMTDQQNRAVIIDYKTGVFDKKHLQQLEIYADTINEMGLKVIKKLLIYINDVLEIKEV